MRIGAHVSAAGGYDNGVKNVHAIGGNALQIFSSPPRTWKAGDPDEDELSRFADLRAEYDVDPVYFHASYMINLAGSPENQQKSIEALIAELEIAGRANVAGSVIHLGSFQDKDASGEDGEFDPEKYKPLLDNIRTVLEKTPKEAQFIIENMGTRKIGRTFEEIGYIVDEIDDDRVRVCLDTCHLHAAGFDLSGPGKCDAVLEHADRTFGRERIECLHVNDSRDEFGSLRDRHENLGEGYVGDEVFRSIVNHKELGSLPLILETPGFDGAGPDQKNVERLRSYITTTA